MPARLNRLSRLEAATLLALLVLLLLALLAPALAQPADYGQFADQRSWWGLPNALDVLSNLPFALGGAWGLYALGRMPPGALARAQRALAQLFFVGLVLTSLCSAWYHWRPDTAGLALDRLGMSVAFAGLLGLAAAERISMRAGLVLGLLLVLLAPLSVLVWWRTGNVLPWALVQFGGMALVVLLAQRPPQPQALGVSIGWLIAFYALAKLAEQWDYPIYAWSQGLVSGHSLKHVLASLAAWPVLRALYRARQRCAPGVQINQIK